MIKTLLLVYNADASIMGKIAYGYRKMTCPKDKSACSACDLTHGGLRLDETAEWKRIKAELAASDDINITQLHRDQLSSSVSVNVPIEMAAALTGHQLKAWIVTERVQYPMLLAKENHDAYRLIMSHDELDSCHGNVQQFLQALQQKGVLQTH